ncbi:MAG: UDP-2,3-diacylglucosamine diphosphatase [Gammaproteobacteria bacterium]|nr:UDP-2,3-diacylglucosamine diphosphatase [Gammaproteobacteria bacterium]
MSYLFASDVHLSVTRPIMVERFLAFLDGPCADARGVYLLGDIFDAWLGDDDNRPPHPRVEAGLARLSDRGVPVWLLHGNHDFLIGSALCARTGCQLLDEEALVQLDGEPVLLMHGDTLCTRDLTYQAFRKRVRDPGAQASFLAQSIESRAAQAMSMKAQSAAATVIKPEEIMDVSDGAVLEVMRRHQTVTLVHGHTHRPAVHDLELDGRRARRIVLGDWYQDERVLLWRDGDIHLGNVASLPA